LPKDQRFDIVTILPGFIFGPSMCSRGFSSGEIMIAIASGIYNQQGLPRMHLCVVDVREVAFAHINAIKIEAAANNRFILVNQSLFVSEMAEPLAVEFN
jgi:nucleoside-diphosphate-sugar epimerase